LLPVVVGVWWLWQRRSDPLGGWRKQIDPELLDALVVGRESIRRGSSTLLLAAWLMSVIAIAGPTWKLEPNPFSDEAMPLMILLKADPSMEQADPAPSRIERARLKIADLAEARTGEPLGLIAYAGSAHLVLPPTHDTAVVAQMAAEISPDIMPQPGDRLDLALRVANRMLSEGGKGGSIVVLADAVNSSPDELKNLKADLPFPVQFLAVHTQDSPQGESLRMAARALRAPVEALSADDRDIQAIVRRAAKTSGTQAGEIGGQWQEAGYWIVPLLVLIMLASFRRETEGETHQ
jgi:Ca-activated chloride channel family protein